MNPTPNQSKPRFPQSKLSKSELQERWVTAKTEILGTLTPRQVSRVGKWAPARQRGYILALSGKCSPRHAIKFQCLDCVGEDRAAITNCGDRCCPLWHFRPFQGKAKV